MTGVGGIVEVRRCPHGRGVFAVKDFARGELIQAIGEMTITTSPKSPPWKRWALIIGEAADGRPLFWDEYGRASAYYWTNFIDHSRPANVRFKIRLEDRTAELVAARSIRAGDELFLDYKEYGRANWTPESESVPRARP